MSRQTEYLNEMFFRRSVMSIDRILTLKSGDSMDIESSYLLNRNTEASPEAILSGMEQVMEQIIDFATIANLGDAPVTMSQTAFDALKKAKVSIDVLKLATHLNDNDNLTVEVAHKIVAEHAQVEVPSILNFCEEHSSKAAAMESIQDMLNQITYQVMNSAYWVAIMSRTGMYSDLPPTFDHAMNAIGIAQSYKQLFFNNDCTSADDTCGQGTTVNNGWIPEHERGGMTPRSSKQWFPLAGNAENILKHLCTAKVWNAEGFRSQADRREKYNEAVTNALRKKNERADAAKGRALQAQATANEQVQAIVASIDF